MLKTIDMIYREGEEDQLLSLVAGVPFGIVTFDEAGRILMMNKQARELLMLKKEIHDLVDGSIFLISSNEKVHNVIRRLIEGKRKSFSLQRIQVGERYLNIRGRRLPRTMLVSIIDTTENVKAVDKATQNLILGQENERARLAKEIHDGVGPMMSSIKLQIDSLSHLASSEKVKSKLASVNNMIAETAKDIRQISHDLMPSSLSDFGLVTAVENFGKRISEREGDGLNVFFSHNLGNVELNEALELNLFRMVQELVNNAIKYAACDEIDIQLRSFDNQIQLTVEDSGIGTDMGLKKGGMGMQNITTRVKILHGTFDVESQPGQGFHAQIIVPINLPI